MNPTPEEVYKEVLEDEYENGEFDKVLGQYRMQLNGLLKPLRLYGQGDYVDQVTDQLVSLGFQLYLKLSGVEIPYAVEVPHW